MKLLVLQSNYIPWKGYFDLIAAADQFVVYDDVQFTKNDWRNRNKIKTPGGMQWLSVPVGTELNRRICDVSLPDPRWQLKHWKTLTANYRRAPFFQDIASWLEPLYVQRVHRKLSAMNVEFIGAIMRYLDIRTTVRHSSEFELSGGKSERLLDLCQQLGAKEYISGPSARAYLNESLFSAGGIAVRWFDYGGYPEYPQLWGPFVHAVSIVDLLFNCGPRAVDHMKLSASRPSVAPR